MVKALQVLKKGSFICMRLLCNTMDIIRNLKQYKPFRPNIVIQQAMVSKFKRHTAQHRRSLFSKEIFTAAKQLSTTSSHNEIISTHQNRKILPNARVILTAVSSASALFSSSTFGCRDARILINL